MMRFAREFISPGQSFSRADAVEWFGLKFPKINPGTVKAHVDFMTVNNPGVRRHHNVRNRLSGCDLFYRLDTDTFRLWDEQIDPPAYYMDNEVAATLSQNVARARGIQMGGEMQTIITRPAALVRQGGLRLYSTSLKVADLLIPNFYSIEQLDPENPDEAGYQRVLNKGRAKKLADYLISGEESGDAFLPTSIFLATDKEIAFDEQQHLISFDVAKIGPFSVVDGQHRIAGLKMAAEKRPDLLNFEIPVNIAVNLSPIAQMCHFLIVNTTQKSVDSAVEQRLYARLSQLVKFENVPNLPKWIARIVATEEDDQALKIIDYLNETPESPWFKKIEMANEDSKTATVNQKSFAKNIKKFVLIANNPLTHDTPEHQQKIFLNYWVAIAALLDSPGKKTVLFKSVGVEFFCRFSTAVFTKLANLGDYKVETFKKVLQQVFDNLEGEIVGAGHPDWWASSTGVAGGLNSAALAKINQEFVKALHKRSGDIDL